jgi:hypothetical protein
MQQGLGQSERFRRINHPYNTAEVLTQKIAVAHVEFRRTYDCRSRPCPLSILSPPAIHIGGPTVCQEMVDPPGTTIDWRSDEVIAVLVPRMEPTMWVRAVIGIVLCAVGTVWILQGTKVIQGSGMSGQGKWAVIGAVVVVVGLACFAWAARYHRKGTTESS